MPHILCPVDFSDLSGAALRYAAMMAKCSQSRITVLHAVSFDAPPYFTEAQIDRLRSEFREAGKQAKAQLRAFAANHLGPDLPVTDFRVVEGPAADAIADTAAEIGADLIVMGTHGRGGVNRVLLGSVAERVIRESRIPVLVVRAGVQAQPAIKNILIPVNDTPASRKALRTAEQLARCFGACLTVLHVRERAGAPVGDLRAWIEREAPKCEIREITVEGDAAEQIVTHASRLSCDLLVIGGRHKLFFDATVLGPTVARVVRHAPCPVLTVIRREPGSPEESERMETEHAL